MSTAAYHWWQTRKRTPEQIDKIAQGHSSDRRRRESQWSAGQSGDFDARRRQKRRSWRN
ncbi:hypothetical protein KCP69_14370 [Salmonella enterica subsp. enterica]|nr:hypothetical protein KCP69_14370 [Salmonella enterica subsp. enterica]